MGVIEEVNKLHITLKSIIIALALVMPFWYFDLYLFHTTFFKNAPIQIPIVASFCISIVWVATHFISASGFKSILTNKFDNRIEKANGVEMENRLLVAVLFTLFWAGAFSFLAYLFKWDFITLLKKSFEWWSYRFAALLIISLLKEKREKKQADKIERDLNKALQ